MHNTIFKFFILLFIVLTLTSCNDYQKILRSEDVGEKYKAAEEYYENEEWRRASNLFEQYLLNIEEDLRLKGLLSFMQIVY